MQSVHITLATALQSVSQASGLVVQLQHETLLEQHKLLQQDAAHAHTLAASSSARAAFYKHELETRSAQVQLAEDRAVRLQEDVDRLTGEALAGEAALAALQNVCSSSAKKLSN
jgi:hypothetical protein